MSSGMGLFFLILLTVGVLAYLCIFKLLKYFLFSASMPAIPRHYSYSVKKKYYFTKLGLKSSSWKSKSSFNLSSNSDKRLWMGSFYSSKYFWEDLCLFFSSNYSFKKMLIYYSSLSSGFMSFVYFVLSAPHSSVRKINLNKGFSNSFGSLHHLNRSKKFWSECSSSSNKGSIGDIVKKSSKKVLEELAEPVNQESYELLSWEGFSSGLMAKGLVPSKKSFKSVIRVLSESSKKSFVEEFVGSELNLWSKMKKMMWLTMGVFGMGGDSGMLSSEEMVLGIYEYEGTFELEVEWENEEEKSCWEILSGGESEAEWAFLVERKKSVGLDKSFKVCPTNSVSHARLYSLKKCKVRSEVDFGYPVFYSDSIVSIVGGGILNIKDRSSYSVLSINNSVAMNSLFYNSLVGYSKFYFMKFNQFGVSMWSFFIIMGGKESCLPLRYSSSSSLLSEEGVVSCFSSFSDKSIFSYSSFSISSLPFCPKKKLKINL